MFWKIIDNMKTLYCKAKIVHADLSEYNIMVWRRDPVFFDFGQAVLRSHPNADFFLERDVRNIVSFFRKRGVDVEAKSVLARILGC